MVSFKLLLCTILSVSAIVTAHSHDYKGHELVQYRRSYARRHQDLMSRCGASLERRRLRRALNMARIGKRDNFGLPSNMLYNHYYKRADSNDTTSSDNSSACLLTPEVTQGPYHVLGELVQQDIRGGEAGIPMHVVVDFVDVDTCEPLSKAWVDVWSANATGHYSGFEANSNGQSGGSPPSSSDNSTSASGSASSSASSASSSATPAADASSQGGGMASVNSATIDSYTAGADSSSSSNMGGGANEPQNGDHFLRGVWQTDDDGVLTMYTIVPGWYDGRAPHIHLKVYDEDSGYRADNGSFIASGNAHHTGQWFFDDDIMNTVAEVSPYTHNVIDWANATKNADDGIYPYANSMGSTANMVTSYINSTDIAYGVIATTVVGINTTYASAELTTFYWDPDQSDDSSNSTSSS